MSRFFRAAGDSDSDSESSDDELMSSGDEAPAQKAATATKPVMSRFLRTGSGSSDSDDSDDSDSDSDSDDDEAPRKSGKKAAHSDSEDEASEEEGRAGVRIMSAQERRLAEMEGTGKAMENALKINDWVAISNGAYHLNCIKSI